LSRGIAKMPKATVSPFFLAVFVIVFFMFYCCGCLSFFYL
jgi:hypothetical protein